MQRLNAKAIGFGLLVDMGGAPTVGLLSRAIAGLLFRFMDGAPEDFPAFFSASLPLLLGSLLIGLALTYAGGATASLVAAQAKLLNALAVGLITLACLIPLFVWLPIWYNLATLILTVPSALLGGLTIRLLRSSRSTRL